MSGAAERRAPIVMSQHSEAELNAKFVETAKLMNIYLNHFPRFEKYALAHLLRIAYEKNHDLYLGLPIHIRRRNQPAGA